MKPDLETFAHYYRLRQIDARLRELEAWASTLREVRDRFRDEIDAMGRDTSPSAYHRRRELEEALLAIARGHVESLGVPTVLHQALVAKGWTPLPMRHDITAGRPGLRDAEAEIEKLREERGEIADFAELERIRRAEALRQTAEAS